MDNVIQTLRLSIVNEDAANDIKAIIGDRVYPSNIASITNPEYPCLNFEASIGVIDSETDIYSGSLRTWVWSSQHEGTLNESWKLHRLLIAYWHLVSFKNTTLARSVRLAQVGQATTLFDPTVRSYSVIADWDLYGAIS